jgi:hypothetical protein
MNFGELLGAGLLGGVGNTAKGAGDRLREEAKQKREMALQAQKQADAMAVQTTSDDAAMARLQAQGLVTIGVNDAGSLNNIAEQDNAGIIASGLLAQKGDIASAAAVVEQANNITNLEKGGEIAVNLAEVQALLNDTTNVKQADLIAAQTKLQASIDKATASQLATTNAATAAVKVTTDADAAAVQVTTDADAVAAAAVVATDAATALAGSKMDMAVYDTATNKDVAAALVTAQKETAEKLGATRMAEINANNVAALAQINTGKIGDVHSFYDETTGMEYKAVRNKDGGWDQQGGTKASTASKNAYTLQDIQIEGVNVRGYMNGTDFVVIGNPIPDSNKTDWDEKQVTDYATAQGWKRVGVAVNIWGRPIGKDISADDKAQVTKWTADVVTQWNKTGTSPATLVNDILGGKNTGLTGGSTGGATNEAADLVKAQNAINNGAPFNAVVQSLKQTYPNIDTSGLKKK